MSVQLLQVTLTAAATQITTSNTFCKQIIIQNNAAHSCRIGDSTVSATKGILLAAGTPGGTINSGPVDIYHTYLSDWWIFGTTSDKIDVLYIS